VSESRESRKSKLKTESRFGGSRVEILSFHSERSLAVWNQFDKIPWSQMFGSISCKDFTREFLFVVGGLLTGRVDCIQQDNIFKGSLFSSILAIFPSHRSCRLATKFSILGRFILSRIDSLVM
jgi:hypothetical protein